MGKPKNKPVPMKLGLTVSCGTNNKMDNAFEIIVSPKLPGKDPVDVRIPFAKPPVSAKEIASKVAAAISKAGGTASAKSHSVSTTKKGKKPTSTSVCLIEITGLASMDIGSSDGKVRLFDVSGKGASGVAAPGGGLEGRKGTGSKLELINCEKYRKKVEEKKEQRRRRGKKPKPKGWGPNPNTPKDWFCNPDWTWTPLGVTRGRGAPAIASLVVGAGEISQLELPGVPGNLTALFMGSEWVVVPFCVIPHSLPLQYLEIRMRLASAGIVTSDRDDGVIEPLGFIEGRLEGEEILAFGFITPYDPLGYGGFPWKIVVGEAEAVASHLAATSLSPEERVAVAASAALWTDHAPISVLPGARPADPRALRPTMGGAPALAERTGAMGTPLLPIMPVPSPQVEPWPEPAREAEMMRPRQHLE